MKFYIITILFFIFSYHSYAQFGITFSSRTTFCRPTNADASFNTPFIDKYGLSSITGTFKDNKVIQRNIYTGHETGIGISYKFEKHWLYAEFTRVLLGDSRYEIADFINNKPIGINKANASTSIQIIAKSNFYYDHISIGIAYQVTPKILFSAKLGSAQKINNPDGFFTEAVIKFPGYTDEITGVTLGEPLIDNSYQTKMSTIEATMQYIIWSNIKFEIGYLRSLSPYEVFYDRKTYHQALTVGLRYDYLSKFYQIYKN